MSETYYDREGSGGQWPSVPSWQLIVQRTQRQWTPEDVEWCCKCPPPFVHPPFWLSMASAHLCFKVFFGPWPDSAWAPGSCNRCWPGSCPSPMPNGNWWIIPACFSSFTLQVGLLSGGCPSLTSPSSPAGLCSHCPQWWSAKWGALCWLLSLACCCYC